MFSVLVLLEDSKNVWSDHLRQKMANPAAKNRFFHFRHAVSLDKQYYDQMEFVIDVGRTRTNHNKVIIIDWLTR